MVRLKSLLADWPPDWWGGVFPLLILNFEFEFWRELLLASVGEGGASLGLFPNFQIRFFPWPCWFAGGSDGEGKSVVDFCLNFLSFHFQLSCF